MSDENRLIITEEELDELNTKSKQSEMVITGDDLDQAQNQVQKQKSTQKSEIGDARSYVSKLDKLDQYLPTQVWQMVLAGLVGALVAWIVNELFFGEYVMLTNSIFLDMAVWGGVMAFIISFAYGAVKDFLTKNYERMWQEGLRQALYGLVGGAIGSFIGQFIYSMMGGGSLSISIAMQVFARTLGWALIGCGIGLANGLISGNQKKVVNGLIGGLAGGAIGGVLFDVIGSLSHTGAISRLVGYLALGAMIGLMIGLIEHLRKEVWLAVESGPIQGKQFILFKPNQTFGSTGKADIVLVGDNTVPPMAFGITEDNSGRHHFQQLSPGKPIYVNNVATQRCVLKNRDLIKVGQHALRYNEVLKKQVE